MKKFFHNTRGNIAIMTGLFTPILLLCVGGAIDFTRWATERAEIQELSDMLATRGAREFLLANTSAMQIESVLKTAMDSGAGSELGLTSGDMNVAVDMQDSSVNVTFSKAPKDAIILSRVQNFSKDIEVSSTAVARGGMNVCIVALKKNTDEAISVGMSAKLSAASCAIYSNSTSSGGVWAWGTAKITADIICSAGGYGGTSNNYSPLPTTDCPEYPDPLAERTPPNVTSPVFNNVMLGEQTQDVFLDAMTDSRTERQTSRQMAKNTDSDTLAIEPISTLNHKPYTLDPGVYVGGITVASNANVTLNPGIYAIQDGSLAVDMGGIITGKGVSFYLVGNDATFNFGPDSKIDLEAPTDGPMAGILFFEDRGAPIGRTHRILSNDARNLLGTFYLSRGRLLIESLQPIADQSAYTVIVAREMLLDGNPTLVLNADYAMTDVPVPVGVGPVGGSTFLRE